MNRLFVLKTQNLSDRPTINAIIFSDFLFKNKVGRGAGQCNWQRIANCWSCRVLFSCYLNLTGIITKFKYEKKSENDSRRSSTVYNDAIVQMIHYLPYLLLTKYHHHCFSSFLSMQLQKFTVATNATLKVSTRTQVRLSVVMTSKGKSTGP